MLKKLWLRILQQKKKGTGLGLPIVTKKINKHSGNFSLKNIRDKGDKKGSIATISLPKYV